MTIHQGPAGSPARDWRRHFGQAVVAWFERTFAAPTPAQVATWNALANTPTPAERSNALVIAPTGSGKTLAAFLMSLDKLSRTPATGGVRVLYVSPLKALAVDIERNLARPLSGIQQLSAELGLPAPPVRVGVRSGDTTPADRRRLLAHPPDILITTPESLFLMLSSSAAETLDTVETVIVDEIHSLAGTKRGAHLALSLERLDARGGRFRPMQRIGLSATARPPARIADFLGGGRDVAIIDPQTPKQWQLGVQVPVDDMANLPPPPGAAPGDTTYSIWPHVEEAILDLVLAHRSTICFVNSRLVAERLTSHLNDRMAARLGITGDPGAPLPNVYTATHGAAPSYDAPDNLLPDSGAIVARAHHGSLSKARRAIIEDDLKAGRLRCVVATSSLELGIDMGFVDLVIQAGSPPSVASGLQRVGRAGHQVGVLSKGVVFPTSRADLVEAAVVVQRMGDGLIEATPDLRNPLDVLAQQIVSLALDVHPTANDVFDLVRRAQPYSALPRAAFDAVLDMLTGRYPSEDFAELRPRLTWNRATDELAARPGARQLVTVSGGTIPDRGLFGVFLVGDDGAQGGRRVGELDEEMVHETRLGDVITLGSSSWRVEAITPHQVQVTPAPGAAGRLPFWHGDSLGRPVELGKAIGAMVAQVGDSPERARARLAACGLEGRAIDHLMRYVEDQKRATGVLPSDKTILLERFRDEMGDWRVCLHAPFGLGVLRPWMLAVQPHLTQRYGVDARMSVHNDGVIWRIPMSDAAPPGADLLVCPPDTLQADVTTALFGSALFAAHFRECAARALLLPRRHPGRRTPLWQQRLRAGQLLEVAAGYRDFPIVMEAMRECLDDVFDLPALQALLADIGAGRVQLVEVDTPAPSPFARSLQFGYTGEFIYDHDQPLAERRAASLNVDPTLLSSLLGAPERPALLDPSAVAETNTALQRLRHRAVSAEALWDVLRTIGPLTTPECEARTDGSAADWLAELGDRVAAVEIAAGRAWCVADDVTLVTEAGLPARHRLTIRWLRCHVVTRPTDLDVRYGWGMPAARAALDEAVATGDAVTGVFDDGPGPQFAVAEVLAQVRRRLARRWRDATKPVDATHLAWFLADWHAILAPEAGPDALARAVEQLAGWPVPASQLETLVLPARVADYSPALLDEALTAGHVVWAGGGAIGDHDGWVTLWPGDLVLATARAGESDDLEASALLARLAGGGAWRVDDLGDDTTAVQAALWHLAWAGLVTADTFAPVRELLRGGHRPVAPPRPHRLSPWRLSRPFAPPSVGRWSLLKPSLSDPTPRWTQTVALLAGRHGIVTRGAVLAESLSFGDVYAVLATMEERGLIRRGYFVQGAGAAQFALPGAVDRLRAKPGDEALVLAANDPANPYGAAVAWPPTVGHQPARRPGSVVVQVAGRPICYLERGAHTLVTFEAVTGDDLTTGLAALGAAVDASRIAEVALTRVNDQSAISSPIAPQLQAAGFRPTPKGFSRRRST